MKLRTREISRSMVTARSIAEISKQTLPKTTSLDETLIFGATCYETGMIEVLRGIASEALEYGMGEILMTRNTKKHLEVTNEKYEELRQNLDKDTLVLLKEFDDASHNSSMADAGDHFIEGFIRGYAYLKQQVEYGAYFGVRGETADE